MDQFYTYFIFAGALVAGVACFGHLVSVGRGHGRYLLSGTLFCTMLWQVYMGLVSAGLMQGALGHLRMTHLPFALSIGPLLYLFLREVIDPEFHLSKVSALHFAPVLLCVILLVPIFFSETNLKTEMERYSYNVTQSALDFPLLSQNGNSIDFYFGVVAFLALSPKLSILFYSGLLIFHSIRLWSRKDSLWQEIRAIAILLFLLTFASAAIALADHFLPGDHFLKIGSALASICIFTIYALDRRFFEPMFLRHRIRGYRHSRISNLNRKSLKDCILSLMEIEKVYLTEDFPIQSFAQEVSIYGFPIQPAQLSEFINSEFGKNYNQFLNQFRIEEACKWLLQEPNQSILSIALAAGFNSKSTFNRVFRHAMKMTPIEYRTRNLPSIENWKSASV
ncbi:hypothetical protein CH373_06360 [Leptospira perolatii]|uniref:HTH araC/xylS-type domain-containing protein n=1 Tax=Leptospira perolatii TaxID=2023191 RepID=A0A2M9ZP82_9LEPT|nr:helix-turn-helix domain-containing protein [Leptospira perolatii]PJZ70883.1 hypothetical protein CH360_05090 [Leptospira perolatii]PJZ73779.1 hypothetical protein CH373_06360 [Leptospira perolatii]